MTDALLQDLWFHHADDVALNSITITPRHVTLHATVTSSAGSVCRRAESVGIDASQAKDPGEAFNLGAGARIAA
ncbi:hypothetical protein ABH932_001472 [Streptacidiphilus sp. MAP5-52]